MASWRSRLLNLVLRLTMKRMARKGLDVARVRAATGKPRAARAPAGCMVSEIVDDGVRLEKHLWPEARTDRVMLYLHGGGYFFGSPATHRRLTIALARTAATAVYSLDYRLAPEHPFPAALDDAIAAYRFLLRTESGRRIVLAGDSAGGGLAIATAVAVRDLGLPAPAALVCFSPWTDLAATGESLVTNSERDSMFPGDSSAAAGRLYLGGADPRTPGASPLYADLTGLPPMLVFVSGDEVLRDDGLRIVAKARGAGVSATSRVVAGMPHVWPLFCRVLPEGRESLAEVAEFLARVS